MEDLLPIIGFIIYVVFQIISAGSKAKKKQNEQQGSPQPQPTKPKETFFERLERQIDEAQEQNKKKTPAPVTEPVERNSTESGPKAKSKQITYESKQTPPSEPKKERQRIPAPEAQSLEITVAPYSNLEENILDDTHLSKLPHDEEITDGIMKNTSRKLPDILEDFNPKKAFIHSLIFERKYFKI